MKPEGGGHRRGEGGPRGQRPDPALERRVSELENSRGIPRAIALQVARGRLDLNDVLTKMAQEAEVERLCRRHNLSRALATQIILGQVALDAVLLRQSMEQHLKANDSRSVLTAALASRQPLQLGLTGHRVVEGTVTAVDRYEFQLTGEGAVHKLRVKWACDAAVKKKVRRAMDQDPALRAVNAEVPEKPQDRYSCSNRRLYELLHRGQTVRFRLLEGESFEGRIAWISRFEVGLTLRDGCEVVLFRHAFAEVQG